MDRISQQVSAAASLTLVGNCSFQTFWIGGPKNSIPNQKETLKAKTINCFGFGSQAAIVVSGSKMSMISYSHQNPALAMLFALVTVDVYASSLDNCNNLYSIGEA